MPGKTLISQVEFEKSNQLVVTYFDLFSNYLEIELNRSTNTIKYYLYDVSQFFRFLYQIKNETSIDVTSITPLDIRMYMSWLRKIRENKAVSVNRRIVSLTSFFKFLVKSKVIVLADDPTAEIELGKIAKPLPKFLSENEINNILKKSGPYRGLFETLYSTGCRVQELVNLNLSDISLEDKTIIIRGGKGDKDRLVLLTNRAKRHLKNYIEGTREKLLDKARKKGVDVSGDVSKAVFISSRYRRIAVRTVQQMVKKLHPDLTPHIFRHSMASHLTMNDTNPRVVQLLLGHASLSTTQIYANVTGKFVKEEFDRNMRLK